MVTTAPGQKKPEDVVFDGQFPGVGKERGFAAPYKTDQGSGGVFVYADGSLATIREDIDMAVLRNLIQIADGDVIRDFPRLQPVGGSLAGKTLVPTIPRDRPGAVARLTVEDRESGEGSSPVPGPPSETALRRPANKAESVYKLRQLAIALHKYHDLASRFPPSYRTDKNGNPLLSWRVHLLPKLGYFRLYQQFNKDEPWAPTRHSCLTACWSR